MCCTLKDALLLPASDASAYLVSNKWFVELLLSYCFLPIISKWSSHPPLTSINKALSLLSPNAPGLKGGVLLQIVLVMLLLTDY